MDPAIAKAARPAPRLLRARASQGARGSRPQRAQGHLDGSLDGLHVAEGQGRRDEADHLLVLGRVEGAEAVIVAPLVSFASPPPGESAVALKSHLGISVCVCGVVPDSASR